ncbi:MAG: hypothetical protein OXF02_07500 [Simkaniaceae bacterium]|nr:hypothetical protein [Simkaniaceae bacterium]
MFQKLKRRRSPSKTYGITSPPRSWSLLKDRKGSVVTVRSVATGIRGYSRRHHRGPASDGTELGRETVDKKGIKAINETVEAVGIAFEKNTAP